VRISLRRLRVRRMSGHGLDRPGRGAYPLAPCRWTGRGEQRSALCVLYHKTFDLGVFTVLNEIVLVSDRANGSAGIQETLLAYHRKPIRPAQHSDWMPQPEHPKWHGREVFKGEARHRE
jgi:hypothetical protein